MRRIADFNNGLGPEKEEFNDTIIRITNAYLELREQNEGGIPTLLLLAAADSVGWEIHAGGAVFELVEDIARRSLYQTPLVRVQSWDYHMVFMAFEERLNG